jgi:hypothetical protein
MNKPLYTISNEYMQAYHALYSDDELTEDIIKDTLSGIQSEIEVKVLNIAAIIKEMEADVKSMKDAEESINGRRKPIEKRIERLKNYILVNLQAAKIESPIKSAEHFISIRKNGQSVNIEANTEIPKEYLRITEKKEHDKILLKQAILDNKEIKGVSLVNTVSLIIK